MDPDFNPAACICEWPECCGGSGIIICEGCGGDLCVCRCGGEDQCPGCEDCDDGDPDGGLDD